MPTLADLEYAYLGTLGATGTTLLDRQFQIYGASKHAYFAALSGLTPVSFFSLQDHKYAYYSALSGLVPANLYSISDHQAAFWAAPPAPPGPTVTFMQATSDAANLTTYTFTAQPIGDPGATRRVVVGISTSSARYVASATIGGIAAVVDTQYRLIGTARIAFISAVVPAGTTADVVVTLDNAASFMGIAVWSLTAGDCLFVDDNKTGIGPHSMPLATSPGNIILGIAHTSGVAAATFAWGPGAELWNADIETTTETYSGTDTVAVGATTTVTLTASGTSNIAVAIVYG